MMQKTANKHNNKGKDKENIEAATKNYNWNSQYQRAASIDHYVIELHNCHGSDQYFQKH